MTRSGLGMRPLFVAAIVSVGGSIAACGSDPATTSSGTSTTVGAANPGFPINRAPSVPSNGPVIAGVPAAVAVAGQPYNFQPTVVNTNGGGAKFSVANLPAWATFNATTGAISGTPNSSQVGKYSNISITLVSGAYRVQLPSFTITVAPGSVSNTVTLSWQAPSENADGTPLLDLTGYKVHYGAQSKTYSTTIQVANAGITTYVVQNLPAGQYFFAVTSYNSAGVESALSPEVSTMVD